MYVIREMIIKIVVNFYNLTCSFVDCDIEFVVIIPSSSIFFKPSSLSKSSMSLIALAKASWYDNVDILMSLLIN